MDLLLSKKIGTLNPTGDPVKFNVPKDFYLQLHELVLLKSYWLSWHRTLQDTGVLASVL